MTNAITGVYEYIKEIIKCKELNVVPEYNFMIVCGANPSKNKNNSVASVIYVQLTDVKSRIVTSVMPNEFKVWGLDRIKLTDNRTRKLGVRGTDFTVLGNTTEREFNDNVFFNYSYSILRGMLAC